MPADWRPLISEKSYPEPFALVMIGHRNGKTQIGWWTGTMWDGAYDINPDTIVRWSPIAAREAAQAAERTLE